MTLREMTLVLLLSSACGTTDPADECLGLCVAPITLLVHGSPAAGAPEVSTIGVLGNCSAAATQPDSTYCNLGSGPGTHTFEVTAPGYMPRQVEAIVEAVDDGVCGCGYEPIELEITLDPL